MAPAWVAKGPGEPAAAQDANSSGEEELLRRLQARKEKREKEKKNRQPGTRVFCESYRVLWRLLSSCESHGLCGGYCPLVSHMESCGGYFPLVSHMESCGGYCPLCLVRLDGSTLAKKLVECSWKFHHLLGSDVTAVAGDRGSPQSDVRAGAGDMKM
uniref:Uncharacterized protein n=1 Tax=Timema cristinae TaxID=61476 RepID=A0A7R9D730_TIMCR|nr:unnamed protein product [Timema cristinae]